MLMRRSQRRRRVGRWARSAPWLRAHTSHMVDLRDGLSDRRELDLLGQDGLSSRP